MALPEYYTINITKENNHTGEIEAPLKEEIHVAFGDRNKNRWQEQELLLAALATNVLSTFSAICKYKNVKNLILRVTATGKIEYGEKAKIDVSLSFEVKLQNKENPEIIAEILKETENNSRLLKLINGNFKFHCHVTQ